MQHGSFKTLVHSNTIPPNLLCGADRRGEPPLYHFGLNPVFEINWTQMAQGDSSAEQSYPACPKDLSWSWKSLV